MNNYRYMNDYRYMDNYRSVDNRRVDERHARFRRGTPCGCHFEVITYKLTPLSMNCAVSQNARRNHWPDGS